MAEYALGDVECGVLKLPSLSSPPSPPFLTSTTARARRDLTEWRACGKWQLVASAVLRQLPSGCRAPFNEATELAHQVVIDSRDVCFVMLHPPVYTDVSDNMGTHGGPDWAAGTGASAPVAPAAAHLNASELADCAPLHAGGAPRDTEARLHVRVSVLAMRGEVSEEVVKGLEAARSYLGLALHPGEWQDRQRGHVSSAAFVPISQRRAAAPSTNAPLRVLDTGMKEAEGAEEAQGATSAWLAVMKHVQVNVTVESLAFGLAVPAVSGTRLPDGGAGSCSWMLVVHVDGVALQLLELNEDEGEEGEEGRDLDSQGLDAREEPSYSQLWKWAGRAASLQQHGASTGPAPTRRRSLTALEASAGVDVPAPAAGDTRRMTHGTGQQQPAARRSCKKRACVKVLGVGLRCMRSWEDCIATPVDKFDLDLQIIWHAHAQKYSL